MISRGPHALPTPLARAPVPHPEAADGDVYVDRLDLGIEAFYKADWIRADSIFQSLTHASPDDPRGYFFASMIPFWEYFFVNQDPDVANSFLERSDKAIQVGLARLSARPSDPYAVMMLSGLHGYQSLVAAGQREYLRALKSGMAGFRYSKQVLGIDPDRVDARIGKGMYHYMVGSIPYELRWMVTLFSEKGDVEQGFEELRIASRDPGHVGTEAKMILAYLYEKEGRMQDALDCLAQLVELYPSNPIFHYRKGELQRASGDAPSAIASYRNVLSLANIRLDPLMERSRDELARLESDLGYSASF